MAFSCQALLEPKPLNIEKFKVTEVAARNALCIAILLLKIH